MDGWPGLSRPVRDAGLIGEHPSPSRRIPPQSIRSASPPRTLYSVEGERVRTTRAAWLYAIQLYQDEARELTGSPALAAAVWPCMDETRHRELIANIDHLRYEYEAEIYLDGGHLPRRLSPARDRVTTTVSDAPPNGAGRQFDKLDQTG